MIKYFSKAFKILNENIILTTPMLLFIILFIFYLGLGRIIPGNPLYGILIILTALFMLAAFFAGWLFMIKKAIDLDKQQFDSEESKAKMSFALIKDIPTGVGEYFLSFLGASILYGCLIFVFMLLTYKVGLHVIGKVHFDPVALKAALNSQVQMRAFVSTLSVDQLVKLNKWNLLIMLSMTTFSFVTMFWASEIVYRTKNAFWAFFKSLSFLFKNFLPSIILFVYISVLNFAISLFSSFASMNKILHFVSSIVYFYFVVYIVVLVFLYYDSELSKKVENKVELEDEHHEQKENENNSDCGTDSLGQECSGDSDGEGKE